MSSTMKPPKGFAPMSCCWSTATMQKRLPFLAWLPDYTWHALKMDFIAGISVGLTVIPQALAYAEVAGLPPQYGLYSAFMGCFVYFFLGTSRDVTLGPTAIMSLLVSFYTFHEPAYAVLLAFLSGCIQLGMGFLRLGFLLDFISCPVIKGFTSAAAIIIGFGQIKNLLGLQHISRQFFLQVYYTFHNIGETRVGDAVLGLVCMVLLLVLKLMRDHVPPVHPEMPTGVRLSHGLVWTATTARNALVVSFAALVAYSFQVTGYQPFVLTGKTPEGLPDAHIPPFSVTTANGTISFTEMVQGMGAGLAVVPLMGLLESIAVAKSFASQNNYRIDANQELLAIGLTNILGSLFSSYPVTGSFGRTAVNAQSGVCSPAGGLMTGALVLLSLDYLTSLFYYIPKSALAAVIIMAVVPLFDTKIVGTLWRVKSVRGPDAGPAAGERPALPCDRNPPGGVTEPGSGKYMARWAALLEDFHKRGATLALIGLQVPVLRVLLSADLKGVLYFCTLEEAEKYLKQEPGTQPYNGSEDSVPEHKIALLKA
ncbi:hypothetical protein E2I00_003441 [Balaenoptera physalus]|uniref:SLC26A/SulP transporter domain-containing protein n=1 Tax=Balaenoptera physalus TaxID=9770 RepID=A0A643C4U9_BALPH|nr:hypothetical protein E2I00_003441 [Balaenoptera physalus]